MSVTGIVCGPKSIIVVKVIAISLPPTSSESLLLSVPGVFQLNRSVPSSTAVSSLTFGGRTHASFDCGIQFM